MNTSKPLKRGRPHKYDYEAIKPQIEQLIEEGYGYPRIAERIGLSTGGAKLVCKRLNLKTRWQLEAEGNGE